MAGDECSFSICVALDGNIAEGSRISKGALGRNEVGVHEPYTMLLKHSIK